MRITKLDMLKLVNTREGIEKVKRFLCTISVETERDDGDLFEVFWHGCSAFKDMPDMEVLNMFWDFHLEGENKKEGLNFIDEVLHEKA